MRYALSLVAGLLFATACRDPQSVPQLIVGADDRVAIGAETADVPERLRALAPAIGRMWIQLEEGRFTCTATYLGNGLAVTAGHCFSPNGTPRDESAAPCENIEVEWGVTWEDARRARSFDPSHPARDMSEKDPGVVTLRTRCQTRLAVQYDDAMDFALFRIDGSGGEPAVAVQVSAGPLVPGTPLTSLGYSRGRPLRWSGACTLGEVSPVRPRMFQHDCDTTQGNSGATLLDARTLQIVGIHNGGVGQPDSDLGFSNEGTSLASLPESWLTELGTLRAPDQTESGVVALAHGCHADSAAPCAGNDENKVWTLAPEGQGFADLEASVDSEEGLDLLVLVDGRGRRYDLSGRMSRSFAGLVLPLKVYWSTDESGRSKGFVLRNFHSYR